MGKEPTKNTKNQEEEWQEIGNLPIWDFEENKILIGTLEKIETDIGPNKSILYTFRVQGDLFKVWGSTVLDQRLMMINIGDEVKIVYQGKQKSPITGRTVKVYKVYSKPKKRIEISNEEIPVIEEEEPPEEEVN